MTRGALITIEGLDGAGKTTLARSLRVELERRSLPVRLLREPGGVEASERVRDLVKQPDLVLGARAEALLFAAARAQLVEQRLEPLLRAGDWVLLDRFVDSSLAYQGAGRGLGMEQVRAINAFATGGLRPDRTLLLQLDPAVGRRRAGARDEADGDASDRIENEDEAFFRRIADGYAGLARAEPERITVLDAALPPQEVLSLALAALADLLGDQPE